MSMNGHAKRTRQTLEALGFELDADACTAGKWWYRHPNAPDQRLGVFAGMSEIAAKKVRNRAGEIAGMSSAGERIPESVRENARIKRQSERAKRQAADERAAREREPYQAIADDRARRVEYERSMNERSAHDRAIRDLMQPGRGR